MVAPGDVAGGEREQRLAAQEPGQRPAAVDPSAVEVAVAGLEQGLPVRRMTRELGVDGVHRQCEAAPDWPRATTGQICIRRCLRDAEFSGSCTNSALMLPEQC